MNAKPNEIMIKKNEFQKLKDEIEDLRFSITMLQQEIGIVKDNKRKNDVVKFIRTGNKNRSRDL